MIEARASSDTVVVVAASRSTVVSLVSRSVFIVEFLGELGAGTGEEGLDGARTAAQGSGDVGLWQVGEVAQDDRCRVDGPGAVRRRPWWRSCRDRSTALAPRVVGVPDDAVRSPGDEPTTCSGSSRRGAGRHRRVDGVEATVEIGERVLDEILHGRVRPRRRHAMSTSDR